MTLSVVIPTKNEAANIAACIRARFAMATGSSPFTIGKVSTPI